MPQTKRLGRVTARPADWSRYGLGWIWLMLEPESRASGQITADMWARMRRLCAEEADLVEQALQQLAQRWPLTQPAAVAFQELGAHLVAAMRATSENAVWNGNVVDVITTQLAKARGVVAGLMEEAAEYREIEARQGIEAADRLYATRRHLAGTPVSWWRGLDAEAQEVAAHAEKVVDDLHPLIKTDDPFEFSGGRFSAPPPTPPIRGGSRGPAGHTGQSHNWDAPEVGGRTVLDGVPSLPAPPIAGSTTGTGAGRSDGSFVDTPAGRVLGPGGVIGAPARDAKTLSATASGLGAPARPFAAAAPLPMMPPMIMGQATAPEPSGQAAVRRRRSGLPSVFEATPGPPPVIRPPDEPVHDPGPGVFGIDL
jgi:hypothetical protein